ncbi:hypothetical protein KSP39_PZI022242 [Platanthera zijinensis]|uniref:Uncharacterized protein n=1 Tax=Platanthera zijinensis TaxID=2320716 RepID=A0AAP0FUE5_9ASPA
MQIFQRPVLSMGQGSVVHISWYRVKNTHVSCQQMNNLLHGLPSSPLHHGFDSSKLNAALSLVTYNVLAIVDFYLTDFQLAAMRYRKPESSHFQITVNITIKLLD